jgi:glutaryl-CoA dehydrogenase (non-decarboxylating)
VKIHLRIITVNDFRKISCKAAVIYEGTRDIHTLMQADWALGMRKEKAARKRLPPWKPTESSEAVAAD